jgi:HEAT repeat protein
MTVNNSPLPILGLYFALFSIGLSGGCRQPTGDTADSANETNSNSTVAEEQPAEHKSPAKSPDRVPLVEEPQVEPPVVKVPPVEPPDVDSVMGKTLDEWLEVLKGYDLDQLRTASIAVLCFGPKAHRAIPVLLEVIREGPNDVRLIASETLRNMGSEAKPALPELLAMLEDDVLRYWALRSMVVPGSDAVPALVKQVNLDPQPSGYRTVGPILQILRRIGPDAVPPLIATFGQAEDLHRRVALARALREFGPAAQPIVPELIQWLDDGELSGTAVTALRLIGPSAGKATAKLISMLDDPKLEMVDQPVFASMKPSPIDDVAARRRLLYAIARVGSSQEEVRQLVVKKLNASERSFQVAAATALLRTWPPESVDTDALITACLLLNNGTLMEEAKKAVLAKGPAATPALVSRLDSRNPRKKKAILYHLMRLNDPRAVPQLIELVGREQDREVRGLAIHALGKIGARDEQTLPFLVKQLDDEASQIRVAAINALGEMGAAAKSAVPKLVDVMNNDKYRVSQVLTALGMIGPAAVEALPALEPLLYHPGHKNEVGLTMRKMGPAAVPTLIRILGKNNHRVAAHVLAQMGPEAVAALPALHQAVEDDDMNLSQAASAALSRIGPPADRALAEASQSRNEHVRQGALRALCTLDPKTPVALRAIVAAAADKNVLSRRQVTRVLGDPSLTDDASIHALNARLADEDATVRKTAAISLATRKMVNPAVIEVLSDTIQSAPGLRLAAIQAAGRLGEEARPLVPHIVVAMQKDLASEQSTTIRALGEIGRPAEDAAPSLLEIARDSDNRNRYLAAHALWKIKREPAAIDVLIESLSGKLRTRQGIPFIVNDRYGYLANLGSDIAMVVPVLLARLETEPESTRVSLATALWKIGRRQESVDALFAMIETDAPPRHWPEYERGGDFEDLRFRSAAEAFANLGHGAPSVVPYLLRATQDRPDAVRLPAARLLWEIEQHPQAVSTLIDVAQNGDDKGLVSALVQLGRIGPPAATAKPLLLDVIGTGLADKRIAAFRALRKIDSEAAAEIQRRWQAVRKL